MRTKRFVCSCFCVLLCSFSSVSAIVVCHDYTYYRVFGTDPSPPSPDYNVAGEYRHRVTRERNDTLGCDQPTQLSVDNDPKCPPAMKKIYKGRGQNAAFLRNALSPEYTQLNMPLDQFLAPGALKPGDVIILGDAHSGYVNMNGNIDHFKQVPPRMDRYPSDMYSSEFWSIDQLASDLAGPLCTKVGERVSYGGVMLDDLPDTFITRGVQVETGIEVWRRKDATGTPSAAKPTATVTPGITPSPDPEPSPTPQNDNYYGVFVMTNVSGGSIFVGQVSELRAKYTYQFKGGGVPGPDGSGTKVSFELKSPQFANLQDARSFYCRSLQTSPRDIPLTGGKKAQIFGRDYWVDTALDCP